MRQRKKTIIADTQSPVVRAFSRVGTILHAAHAQDFERRRRPELGKGDSVGLDEDDEDDNDDTSDEEAEDAVRRQRHQNQQQSSKRSDGGNGEQDGSDGEASAESDNAEGYAAVDAENRVDVSDAHDALGIARADGA